MQSSILIFQLIHHDKGESLIYLSEKKVECASIITSLVAVIFGLTTHWLLKYRKNPKITEKLRLASSNMADVCLRLTIILSISVFSMRWKYGLIGIILALILLLWLSPVILSLFHICSFKKRLNTVDRSLVLVPMPWHQICTTHDDQKEQEKLSRILNKIVGIIAAIVVTAFEVMCVYGPNPLPDEDSWYELCIIILLQNSL